ncbi:MAG TPA: hypothetical protein VGG91_15040 [Myxococcaceae bacterium]
MHRRSLLAGSLALLAARSVRVLAATDGGIPGRRTRWVVRTAEGLDAISFLGPLSGRSLYTEPYAEELTHFAPRLSPEIRADVPKLWDEAGKADFGLLAPGLDVIFSSGHNGDTLDTVLAGLDAPETKLLPAYKDSPYWDQASWDWFLKARPRLIAAFRGMRTAGFVRFRNERVGKALAERVKNVQRDLDGFDVIKWQEKLTGRTFDPTIDIVLLAYCKPHGIKVQGQTFLQAYDYDIPTTVRIAAHEMLHPPVKLDGPAARAALDVLSKDPLMTRIVKEHDPRWGYTTLEGLLNEDLCQALDQLISEALGVGRNPADRWRKSDDGIHVLAAAFYGYFRDDHWIDRGGSLEMWLSQAVTSGRLAPEKLHAEAARVLERPVAQLWPVSTEAAR